MTTGPAFVSASSKKHDGHVPADLRSHYRDILQEAIGESAGLDAVAAADNLINAGLTSLAAARIVVAVRERGVETLELPDLFEFPSVEQLAVELAERDTGTGLLGPTNFVTLAESGDARPVFCVHGGNGRAAYMRPLFAEMAARTGVGAWGIEAIGMDAKQQPISGVRAMARRYLQQVRAVQPDGPYRLAGYCAGGEIAFEMATQLRAAGEDLEFLGIIDPFTPAEDPLPSDDELRSFRVEELIGHCVTAGYPRSTVDPGGGEDWSALAEALAAIGRIPREAGADVVRAHVDVWLNNVRSLAAYRRPDVELPQDVFVTLGRDVSGALIPKSARVHLFEAHHDYVFESQELAHLLARQVSARQPDMDRDRRR